MERHDSEQTPRRVREHLYQHRSFWKEDAEAGCYFRLHEGVGIGMPSLSHTHLTPGLHPSFVAWPGEACSSVCELIHVS